MTVNGIITQNESSGILSHKGGEVTGVITEDTIIFDYDYDDTKDITTSSLYYTVTVYKADRSEIKDTNFGLLYIAPAVDVDPV